MSSFNLVESDVRRLIAEYEPGTALQLVCECLRAGVAHYDWVGYYIAVPEIRELALGPFDGEKTDHIRIPYGQGICGQAADRLATFTVQDVNLEANYLSCSPRVKSEIVVPVFLDGEFIAEIDIDSHELNVFSDADEAFLKIIAEMTAPLIAKFRPAQSS
ncbi:MAG: GAF domain-containing protein [Spirochaetaceae bacterium]|nr:MAG: GAF domain-containing protein [Spirochaetaceae bacterium]